MPHNSRALMARWQELVNLVNKTPSSYAIVV